MKRLLPALLPAAVFLFLLPGLPAAWALLVLAMPALWLAFADQDDDDELDSASTLMFTPAELEQIRKLGVQDDDDEAGTKTMMFMPAAAAPKAPPAAAAAPATKPEAKPSEVASTQFYMPSVQPAGYQPHTTDSMPVQPAGYQPHTTDSMPVQPAGYQPHTTDSMPAQAAPRQTQDRFQAQAAPAPKPPAAPQEDLGSASTMLFSAADIRADLAKATARTTGRFTAPAAPEGGTLMFGALEAPPLAERLDEIESAKTMVFSAAALGELQTQEDRGQPEPAATDEGARTMLFGTNEVQAAVEELRRKMGAEAEQGSQTVAFMPAQGKTKLDEAMELLRQNAEEARPAPAPQPQTKAQAAQVKTPAAQVKAPAAPSTASAEFSFIPVGQSSGRRRLVIALLTLLVGAAALGAAAWFLDWL
jgi:hypothetical protein